MPRRISPPGFSTSRRTLAVRMIGIEDRADIADRAREAPCPDRRSGGCRRTRPAARTARLFSYTSHTIQTWERSEMVNGLGEASPCVPEAAVTCWSVITPETGAKISTIGRGVVGVGAQHLEMLERGLDRHFGLGLGILRHFQILLRNGALVEQQLGAVQLGARPALRRPPPGGNRKTPARCPRSALASGAGPWRRYRPAWRGSRACGP